MQTSGSLSSVVQNMNLIYCLSPPYFRCHILKIKVIYCDFLVCCQIKKLVHALSTLIAHMILPGKKHLLSEILMNDAGGYLAYRVVYEQRGHLIWVVLMAKCACTSLNFFVNELENHKTYPHTLCTHAHSCLSTQTHTCTHTKHTIITSFITEVVLKP